MALDEAYITGIGQSEVGQRLERHPLQLLASQTHDTKRAGDVRARIGALAGMAEDWAAAVRRWRDLKPPAQPLGDARVGVDLQH